MNIIYGVSGEGLGHASRAREIIEHLKKQRHNVTVITYGRALIALKDFSPIEVPGINLHVKNNSLSLPKTLLKNISFIITHLKNWPFLVKLIKSIKPDLFITDFEPITARLAYKIKKPLISIDNQQSILHQKIKIPFYYKKSIWLTKTSIKRCVPKAEAYLSFTLSSNLEDKNNLYFTPPLIRKEILKIVPSKKKHILVYLSKPSEKIIELLIKSAFPLKVYGTDKNETIGSVEFKPISHEFVNDLASSKAIIASSGFSLISESIYLKKPYLALPIKNHGEQLSNALSLKSEGFGDYAFDLNRAKLNNFIKNLPRYEKNLKAKKIDYSLTIKKLDKLINSFAANTP